MTIDKGIPIPAKCRGNRNAAKYPFRDLALGDSFVIAAKVQTVSSICAYWRRTLGHRYTMRASESGVRVWRTA